MENQQGGLVRPLEKHPVVSKYFFTLIIYPRLPDAFLPLNFFCVTNWCKILGTPFNGCIGFADQIVARY